jgi:hypothetical protein
MPRSISLRADSERTLATILITNNFVNVTIIMLCNYIFASIIDFGSGLLVAVYLYHHTSYFYPVASSAKSCLRYIAQAPPAFLQEGCQRYPVSAQVVLASRNDIAPQWYHWPRRWCRKENHVLSVDDLEQALELTDKNDIKE